nr:protein NETWORKED 1D-like [Coffea arabica]
MILERLASDAQKLTSLHLTVQNLRRKLDTNKKSQKIKDVDLETVKEQLQEVQETVIQLVDLNGQLMRNIEENPSCSGGKSSAELKEDEDARRKVVSEQARKGSEKIGRLQLEVQKLQYVCLNWRMKRKAEGKADFPRAKQPLFSGTSYTAGGRTVDSERSLPFADVLSLQPLVLLDVIRSAACNANNCFAFFLYQSLQWFLNYVTDYF